MIGRRTFLALLGLGLLGSQAGHLVAYQLRFGAAAQQVQGSGAHAYFPTLLKTSLGVGAGCLVAGLLLIGLARVLVGRRAVAVSRPPFLAVLALLFTVQLSFFIGQEVSEAALAGARMDSAAALLLWGTIGQLPVAALASLALCWMASRFESALDDVRGALALPPSPQGLTTVTLQAWSAPARASLQSTVAGASLIKRGPPSSLRISSY
jgi:hypothetical protein